MRDALREFGGVQLRGGDVDESPCVYRKLEDVLAAQGDTIAIRHRLRPVGVVMAGANTFDPFKDQPPKNAHLQGRGGAGIEPAERRLRRRAGFEDPPESTQMQLFQPRKGSTKGSDPF
jgi:hypothetical protein